MVLSISVGSLAGLLSLAVLAIPQPVASFTGICNASSAVAIGPQEFVVADDEDGLLEKQAAFTAVPMPFRVYLLTRSGSPILVGNLPGKALLPARTWRILQTGDFGPFRFLFPDPCIPHLQP